MRLREIRVSAAQSSDDTPCTLTFQFVKNGEHADFDGRSTLVGSWLKLVPESGRPTKICGQTTTLENLRAADYVDSEHFDLDHFSSPDEQ